MSVGMLVETTGRDYTAAEYRLTGAGLGDADTIRFPAPGVNGAVLAQKP